MRVGARPGYFVVAALFALGFWNLGQGAYIPAKAWLAQELMQRAWQRADFDNDRQAPWPWADTWPVARLKANDSQECRNCHQTEHMLSVIQSSQAQRFHRALKNNRRTCIDCHAGIAHPDNSG